MKLLAAQIGRRLFDDRFARRNERVLGFRRGHWKPARWLSFLSPMMMGGIDPGFQRDFLPPDGGSVFSIFRSRPGHFAICLIEETPAPVNFAQSAKFNPAHLSADGKQMIRKYKQIGRRNE